MDSESFNQMTHTDLMSLGEPRVEKRRGRGKTGRGWVGGEPWKEGERENKRDSDIFSMELLLKRRRDSDNDPSLIALTFYVKDLGECDTINAPNPDLQRSQLKPSGNQSQGDE